MIEFFVTGDFKVIQSQVYIILAMWVIMRGPVGRDG